MLRVYTYMRPRGITLLGPNCPGALSPGVANVGIIPAQVFAPGPDRAGVALGHADLPDRQGAGRCSASATRRSSASAATRSSGQSFIDVLERFEADPETELVVMVGEIGGDEEEKAADYIAEHMTKPVVAYIAGFPAPPGKTMGHAGAIISGSSGTAAAKKEALEARGVRVGDQPDRGRRSWRPRRPRSCSHGDGGSPSPAASRRPTCCPSPTSRGRPAGARARPCRRARVRARRLRAAAGVGRPPLRRRRPARVLWSTARCRASCSWRRPVPGAGAGGRRGADLRSHADPAPVRRRRSSRSPWGRRDGRRRASRRRSTGRAAAGLVYMIPNFQNPSGVTLSRAKRRRVVALAREHGFLVLEDDPYGVLRFEGEREPRCTSSTAPATSSTRRRSRRPSRPASAPATWCCRSSWLRRSAELANTYIAPNIAVRGDRRPVLPRRARSSPTWSGRRSARERRDAMEQALREHFPEGSSWTTPRGGYFYWVTCRRGSTPPRRWPRRPRPASRTCRHRVHRLRARPALARAAGVQRGAARPDPRGDRAARRRAGRLGRRTAAV